MAIWRQQRCVQSITHQKTNFRKDVGETNDLYVFYGTWTHWWGSNAINVAGNYVEQGNPTVENSPGARRNAVIWMDESNDKKLWVFGGEGYGLTGSVNNEIVLLCLTVK